ncbi:hypothetical protein Zmor_012713 [Zophobas morio]|uniref:G-protein coupled receptors family 1 profile domain-containing protein n=1 Tax=Zophobas morio TaxID=2755281 RepID=A0AA38IE37_9CUCU|nr:hypothetical protein Zmor_012713 [Zophobas morio]
MSAVYHKATIIIYNTTASAKNTTAADQDDSANNWWALSALILAVGTAAGNILVCLAICWERRLQNVTNYFLMSLAITDLMVAILVMPLGILTLIRGKRHSKMTEDDARHTHATFPGIKPEQWRLSNRNDRGASSTRKNPHTCWATKNRKTRKGATRKWTDFSAGAFN